ncbi:hypothetical protein Tco_0105501 [Tanacetum coccineum]
MAMRVVSGQLANLNLADLYDGLDFEMHLQFVFTYDMPIMDEVVFKIHKNGYFEFDPLSLDLVCSEIKEYTMVWFYGLQTYTLNKVMKLLHTDNDVIFFCDTEKGCKFTCILPLRNGTLGKWYYLRNTVMGRKSVQTSRKGKEIMYEFPCPSPTKESQLDACSMSPYKLVEWEQQEAGSPYLRTPPLKPRRKADELVLHDDWQYEGLAVDDVGGSSKHCDLLHEDVVYNGHSLPNMDKERFSNNVVLDDVVTDTLAYTLPLVLKKKCRNKCIPGAGDTYLPYNLSRVVAHKSYTADRHHYLPPVMTRSSSCFLD